MKKIAAIIFIYVFVAVLGLASYSIEPFNAPEGTKTEPKYVPGQLIVKLKPKLLLMSASTFSSSAEGVTIRSPAISILNKRFGVTKIEKMIKKNPGALFGTTTTVPQTLSEIFVFHIPETTDVKTAISEYSELSDVDFAEPNYIFATCITPNDTYFPNQWGLIKVSAQSAWDTEKGTKEVVIAIVDTGVDYLHPDLQTKMWVNKLEDLNNNGRFDNWLSTVEVSGEMGDLNGIDEDGNGFADDVIGYDFVNVSSALMYPGEDGAPMDPNPMDYYGHGTLCSGVAAAATNNGIGIAGLGWDCSIMAVRAGFKSSSGGGSLYLTDIVNAIYYAADNGADVISMSFGGSGASDSERIALEYAFSKGCVLVAAAGNSSMSDPFYPAAFENVIAVAATDQNDVRSYFSNFGTWVDVAAPGETIMSTYYQPSSPSPHTYASASGTSLSAPLVSGLAALIRAKNPSWSNADVANQLIGTADNIDDKNPSYIGALGSGRINASRALTSDQLPTANITYPQLISYYAPMTGTIEIRGTAGGNNFSKYTVEYARKDAPENWILIGATHESPVSEGTLESLSTFSVNDGQYLVRLTVTSALGGSISDFTSFLIDNCRIIFPDNGTIMNRYDTIVLSGEIVANDFVSYRAEWAKGAEPTSGWSSAGITLIDGGTIQKNNESILSFTPPFAGEEGEYTLRLEISCEGRTDEERLHLLKDDLVSSGWPRQMNLSGFSAPVTDDMANTGKKNVFFVTGRSPYVYTFQGGDYIDLPRTAHGFADDGLNMPGWPKENLYYRTNFEHTPGVADIDGNGEKDVIVHDKDYLHVYRRDGSELPGFPKPMATHMTPIALYDAEQDGKVEIFAFKTDGGYTYLYCINYDGSVRPGWPVLANQNHINIMAGDIDNDGSPEIVTTGLDDSIDAFRINGARVVGFPAKMPDTFRLDAQPILFDFDGDDDLEIVAINITASNITIGTDGNYYIVHHNGSLESGFPKKAFTFVVQRPAMGDIDGDGKPEIVAVSFAYGNWAKVFAVNPEDGTSVPNFPFTAPEEEILMEPAIADVDGDGEQEIIVTAKVWKSDLGRELGRVYIIERNGTVKPGWPRYISSSLIPSTCQDSVPNIADLDGDGFYELIQASSYYTKRYPLNLLGGSEIIVWDLSTLNGTSTGTVEWHTLQHDNYHTSRYGMEFIPPSIESFSPSNGSIDHPINTSIVLMFNEPLITRTATNPANYRIFGDKSGPHTVVPIYVKAENKVILESPELFSLNETVYCTVEGWITDLYGNALIRNSSLSGGKLTLIFGISDISLSGIRLTDTSSGSNIYTNARIVSLEALNVAGTTEEMMISEEAGFAGAIFSSFENPTTFELSEGDGTKVVYYKFRNDLLKQSQTVEASIVLDTIPPAVLDVSPASNATVRPSAMVISATTNDILNETDATKESYFNVFGSVSGAHLSIPTYNNTLRKVTFNPQGQFEPDETVTCNVSENLRDKAENCMVSAYTWSFKIARLALEGIRLSNPLNGDQTRSNSTVISVEALQVFGSAEMMILSESANFSGADWETFRNPASFALSAGDGTKTIYYRIKNQDFETETLSSSIILDTSRPTVATTDPSDGSSVIPVVRNMIVSFNEKITLEGLSVIATPTTYTGSPFLSAEGKGLVLPNVPLLGGKTYLVTIESLTDLAGNPLEVLPYTFWFKTKSGDIGKPKISNIRFDDTLYTDNAIISSKPRITATVVDTGTPESDINMMSIYLTIGPLGRFLIDSFSPAIGLMTYNVKSTIPAGSHLITVEAEDTADPVNRTELTLKVRVASGAARIEGIPMTYPAVFKPASMNPGDRKLMISYNLTAPADINIYLYDLAGKIVMTKKFRAGDLGGRAGYNGIEWNGITDFGSIPGNGIYVMKITSGKKVLGTTKVVVYE